MRLLTFCLVLAAFSATARSETLLTNVKIVASPGEPARAGALAIAGGRIEFSGPESEARHRWPDAAILDGRGGYAFPGFVDSHGHTWELGELLEMADLKTAGSPQECVTRIRAAAARSATGEWIRAYGWNQNNWAGKAFPDAKILDAEFPSRPVVAKRIDGHAVWVSSEAMRRAGITKDTREPEGGKIVRRPDGTPSGVFLDNAADLLARAEPPPTREEIVRRFRLALAACAEAGLTGIGDASGDSPGYDDTYLPVLRDMARRGELPIRVYATVGGRDPKLDSILAAGRVSEGLLTIRAVKIYADGALGSRGAALLEDYSDDPGNRGFFLTEPSRMESIVEKCFRAGFQPWIHAIGDRANRAALDAIEKAEAAVHPRDARPRIEHAQVVDETDRKRFAALGVIASIQPSFATSDMSWAGQRLSSRRIGESYAWRSLKTAGARLCGGSDFPWESNRPLLGIYAAIAREDLNGKPTGGWRPGEDLTPAEAVALYTRDAAFASFSEATRGRIAPNGDADLTILDRDVTACPPSEIPGSRVLMTVVAGQVVFRAP
ncbi:MAG: amidohydrolase [Thermoanaerobaculia bacterium]